MKLKPFVFILAVFSCSCKSDNLAQDDQLSFKNISDEQTEIIQKYAKVYPENTQFSIAIIKDNDIVFAGVIRKDDTLRSIDNENSVYEIGSVTKVFTSVLLANMVVEGKVTLEDPVSKYLPYPLHTDKTITLQNLANHTSGFPRVPSDLMDGADPADPYAHYDDQHLQDFLSKRLELQSEPGEKYSYSNLAAGLLGNLLSKLNNSTYEELLQSKVLQPLKMNNTSTLKEKVADHIVTGLGSNGEEVSNWDLSSLSGAGAIKSSVVDMAKFAIANFSEDEALALAREKTFTVSPKMDIALGWHVIKTSDGELVFWHNGGTGGYTSELAINIEKKTSVIILTNVSAFHAKARDIDQMSFDLMKTL